MAKKIEDRKRWRLLDTRSEIDLKYVKKPAQKQLYKLQEEFRDKFLELIEEAGITVKCADIIHYLHSVIIQGFEKQHRLVFVFFIENENGELEEKKIAVKTVGSRIKADEERDYFVGQIEEIKAVFGALRNVSKAIESLT